MRVLCAALLVLAAAAAPRPAEATVGRADRVFVVGYEPTDGKVFVVRDPEGVGGPPEVSYFVIDTPPDEQRPDTPVRVRSWPADEAMGRLQALRQRVVPLEVSSRRGASLSVTYGPLVPCPTQPLGTDDVAKRTALSMATDTGQITVEADGQAVSVAVCQDLDVVVRHAGLEARTSITTWGAPAIASVHRIPGSEHHLVILEHTGVTIESGYAQQVPLLMTAPDVGR